MPKSGQGFAVRATSSCISVFIKLLIVAFFLAGAFMLASILGLGGGILPDEIAMLDFLSPAPKSFKEARSLAKEGQYEKAIRKYNEFFRNDAEKANDKTVTNAHIHLAQIYFEMADSYGTLIDQPWKDPAKHSGRKFTPKELRRQADDATRMRWRRLAREHCDKALAISPNNPAASRLKTMIDNSEFAR